MADQDFVVSVGGEQFFTGLIAPEKVENVFLSYPPKQVLELDAIKYLYSQPGRKHGLEIYTRRKQQGRKAHALVTRLPSCEARRAFDRKVDVELVLSTCTRW